ncbi:MAG: hypothetical protein Q7R99_00970 [bacterium]|nr:hypothetical protein [bacterium]
MKNITKKILSVILLVALGVGGRVFFVNYIGIPNFEIVSSFALLSGFFLGGIFSFVAPLLIIFLSDLFIGNTAILLFTWSAFGIIGLMGMAIKKGGFKRTVLQAPIFGIIASCFFFIYTNFGWWVLSGMYPHTLSGLIACYVNALPFFKTNLLGNLILAPMVFSAFFAFKTIYNSNLRIVKRMLRIN